MYNDRHGVYTAHTRVCVRSFYFLLKEYFMQYRIQTILQSTNKKVHSFMTDQRAELDEKAILIAFFVIVVAGAVGILGTRVSGLFNRLANMF
jgi:Flp pilus assembly pilin Flp